MAMMISKFHKLIQSRILWGVFLIVIVFSFVIWGMVWPDQMDKASQANAAGILDGEPVSRSEFMSAYRSTYLARALSMGRDVPNTPESEERLRRLSWQRLATLREAAKLGITVSSEELVGVIRANFSGEGQAYDPRQYRAFIQNMIHPLGFTELQFEQNVREEIIMQKLGNLIGRQAFVTPLEIRRTFDTLLDTFMVEYAAIPLEEIENRVKADEDAARRLFDEDPEAFMLPERRVVSYAAFPIPDLDDGDVNISEDDILDYYEIHIEEYTRTEETDDGETREVVEELETVEEDIQAVLRRQAAVERADSVAKDLAFRAIPDRDGRIPVFAEEAEKSGVEVQQPDPFSRFDVPVEDGGPAFTAAAFELEMKAFDRVSDPVAGENNVYVLYLESIQEPHVPDFDEAREQAMEAARQDAVRDAIQARAKEVQEAARTGLAEGLSFAEALRDLDVEVAVAEPFTGISGSSSSNAAVQALVQEVVAYNPGEVTEPVLAEDGLIVAYLNNRTPGDPATYDAYREEISSAIRGRRAQGLFYDWQAELLAPERFTDLQRPEPADDLEDDGGEDAPGTPAEEM